MAKPNLHLVDATYELFRHYFAVRARGGDAAPSLAPDGRDVGATRGVMLTLLYMCRDEGATHVACATDHVVRSFRNDLYDGYKTEAGVPAELMAQFPLVEEAIRQLGMVCWPMVEFEADDALASGAARYAADAEQVFIATPDKDMAQCVRGTHVIMLDRMRKKTTDEDGVRAKFGVSPSSIADYLALVGDSADGYPGLPGWGARSAAALLARWGTIEAIPSEVAQWDVKVRGADKLAATLAEQYEDALLFKRLATLREDVPLTETFADLEWKGALPSLREFCASIGAQSILPRVHRWQ